MSKPAKICTMCGTKITQAMVPYGITIGEDTKPCCGRCFALVRLTDLLKGVTNLDNDRRPGLQVHNRDVH